MKNEILEEVLSQFPTIPLYHYTNQAGLIGIVEKTEIWATHTQYLNDSREYLHAVDMVRDQIHFIADSADEIGRQILSDMELGLNGIEGMNVCVCSFSEDRTLFLNGEPMVQMPQVLPLVLLAHFSPM